MEPCLFKRVSQDSQEAGRKALSNRAEKQHCQCKTQPFPTKNHCTNPKHGVICNVPLKEGVRLWFWRWAIMATGPRKKHDGNSAVPGNCIFLAESIPPASAGKGALPYLSPSEEAGVIQELLIVPTEELHWCVADICHYVCCASHVKKHEFKHFSKLC